MASFSSLSLSKCYQFLYLISVFNEPSNGTPYFKGTNAILSKSDKPIFKGNEEQVVKIFFCQKLLGYEEFLTSRFLNQTN